MLVCIDAAAAAAAAAAWDIPSISKFEHKFPAIEGKHLWLQGNAYTCFVTKKYVKNLVYSTRLFFFAIFIV